MAPFASPSTPPRIRVFWGFLLDDGGDGEEEGVGERRALLG